MAMTYATVTGRIVIPGTTTGIPGELRATPLTDGGVLAFPAEDYTTVGAAVADVAADGTLTPDLQIPTDVPAGTLWRLVFHPKGKGNLPVRLGDYEISASADIADLVAVNPTVITPTMAAKIEEGVAALSGEDTAVAFLVEDTGSETHTALSATIAAEVAAEKDVPGGLASVDPDTGYITDRLVGPRSLAPRGKGVVCFTWDDGYATTWSALADKADDLGQKHTFCVTTNRIDTADGVTTAEIASWHARGHEIASHSVTHPNISSAAVGTRVTEYDTSKTTLEAIVGAGKVTTFVYPYGNRSTTTDREIFGRYDRVLDYQAAAPVALEDRRGVFHIPRSQFANLSVISEWIRLAAKQPIVVVIAGHNPGGLMLGGGADPISLADAFAAMQLAKDLSVPCLTTAEVFNGGSMLMDPSFESGNLSTSVWRLSGSGTTVPTVTPDTGLAGTKAAQIAQVNTFGAGFRQLVPVTPGRSYTLSGRARITSGTITTGYTRAEIGTPATYAGPGTADNLDASSTVVAQSADVTSTAWTRFSVDYVVPQGVRYLEVRLVSRNQSGITAQFDHIHFGPTEFGSFG